MPTREEYENHFEPLISRELNEYSGMARMQNDYEKVRSRSFQPREEAPIETRARMEAMIADMRRQDPEFVRGYATKVLMSQAKGTPVKLPSFDEKEVPVSDISYVLAESLEKLYASEDPRAEYYDWVQVQHKVEVDINTNGTTEEEIVARDAFIGFMDDRETELKLVIGLYQIAERNGTGHYKEIAQNKLTFLMFKLSELRRLRDRTKETKSRADEQERDDQQMARTAGLVLGGVAMAAAAEDLVQTRHNYLQNQIVGQELETAVEGINTSYRPVTQSTMEVMAKKETLHNNKHNMRLTLEALRMGKTIEDLRNEDLAAQRPQLVQRSRSFDLRRYNELENQGRMSA